MISKVVAIFVYPVLMEFSRNIHNVYSSDINNIKGEHVTGSSEHGDVHVDV